MAIAGLILAAGGSSRMKTPKQSLAWGATSLLDHVIQIAKQALLDELYVVVGAEADHIREHIALPKNKIIYNEDWEQGLGTSIAKGIQTVIDDSSIVACLVLLADQPFVTPAYLNSMITAYAPEKIIASSYGAKAGVPCLFPRRYFPNLLGLEGDRGAGKLLHKLKRNVLILEAPVDLRDIDTPETYQKYLPK